MTHAGFDRVSEVERERWKRPTSPLTVLGVQVLLLALYGAEALVGAASSPSSAPWGFFVVMGIMWLVATSLLVFWSRQGREGVVARAFAWGLLAWLTIFLLLLLLWWRTRKVLVPPSRESLESWPSLYS